MAQHGDLKLRLGRNALVGPEQAEDTAQEEVEDGPDHGAALSQIGSPPQPSGGDRVSGPHGFSSLSLPSIANLPQPARDHHASVGQLSALDRVTRFTASRHLPGGTVLVSLHASGEFHRYASPDVRGRRPIAVADVNRRPSWRLSRDGGSLMGVS